MTISFQVLRIKFCGCQRGHKPRLAAYTLHTLARLNATVIHCAILRHVSNAVLFDSEYLCIQRETNFAGYLHVKGGRHLLRSMSDLAPSKSSHVIIYASSVSRISNAGLNPLREVLKKFYSLHSRPIHRRSQTSYKWRSRLIQISSRSALETGRSSRHSD